jgi:hypothetical protein
MNAVLLELLPKPGQPNYIKADDCFELTLKGMTK